MALTLSGGKGAIATPSAQAEAQLDEMVAAGAFDEAAAALARSCTCRASTSQSPALGAADTAKNSEASPATRRNVTRERRGAGRPRRRRVENTTPTVVRRGL